MNSVQTCFFFQAEDGIRDYKVTRVQTCALPMFVGSRPDPVRVTAVIPNGYFSGYRREAAPNFVFLSARQSPMPPGEITFHVRHAGNLDLVAPIRRATCREKGENSGGTGLFKKKK